MMQQTKYAEVFYEDYCDILTKNFRSYLEQEIYIDVMFLCKYNKKVPAHQIVLGSFSPLLHLLFTDHQQYFKGHIAYICVPDINAKSLENILKFIYYGKVELKNKGDLSRLCEDLVLLDLPANVMLSEKESFCTFISGNSNSNDENQSSSKFNEIRSESVPVAEMYTISDEDEHIDGMFTKIIDANGVSSSSSSLPVISSVITLDPRSNFALASCRKNIEESTNTNIFQDEQCMSFKQHISRSEDSSPVNHLPKQCSTAKLDKINYTQQTSSLSNLEVSSKKKNHLLAVLKKVKIACKNLESVGVSDDEYTRNNLQSRLRIVKQCIVDINDLLSTEVTISSQGNYKFVDVEKDWELKIMLGNCLETLPRLEKAIENSNNKGKRHKRRERRDSVEKTDY